MKKFIYFLLIFMFPIWVFAYSEYIIPGGDTLGINVKSKGIIIVGFYKINGSYINNHLKMGDRIIEVNGVKVNSTDELVKNIDRYMEDDKVKITYLRDDKIYSNYLYLVNYKDTYRTGIYIKSEVLGVGTLTYIDPDSGVYGVLGHSLTTSNLDYNIEVRDGSSYMAYVTSFTRSVDGNPGSKNADINNDKLFGSLISNTNYGVYGFTNNRKRNTMKVGSLDDVSLGEAYIYTTNLNNEVEKYKIKILEVNKNTKEKNLFFEIVDERLLSLTGGIVQGMSGSPIIQDDKIVGAVTRVIVDDVSKGYGISIITMLNEGDKLVK